MFDFQAVALPLYWFKENIIIGASSTVNSTDISTSSFRVLKYIVSLWNTSNAKIKGMEILIANEFTDISDTVYGRVGNGLNVQVNAVKSGSNVHLEFVNSETFAVSAEVLYATIGVS